MKSRFCVLLAFVMIALLLTACPPTTLQTELPYVVRTTQTLGDAFATPTWTPAIPPVVDNQDNLVTPVSYDSQGIDYWMYPPGTVFFINEQGELANARVVPELVQPEWDAQDFPKGFNTVLYAGHWKTFRLGGAASQQGYLVDVSPQEASVEGAEVVSMVMPEYDGERWVDVLWLFQPKQAPPLPVYVQVYATAGWQVAYHERLYLEPGVWQGYAFDQSNAQGGFVVEVSPQGEGERGDTLQRFMINPEFPGGWQETLRIQTLPSQTPMQADVKIYRTPLNLVKAEVTARVQPGEWYSRILGLSQEQTAYVMEVTPLSTSDNQVESYGVLPVFMDGAWMDVFRVRLPADRPPMEVNMRVYALGPDSQIETLAKLPTVTPDRLATEWASYIYATSTPTPPVTRLVSCPGALPPRLQVGQSGFVSLDPPVANRVRREPNRDAEVLGQMMPGEKFTVLDGPRCADGWTWWRVRSRVQDLEGWTSEGDAEKYWLEPFRPESVDWGSEQDEVTLVAGQLDSANDIEAAINRATAEGTRPGTVTLDGRRGAFVFTSDDRSINIFVSNLRLRGVNHAVIENCDDGLFFDNFPLKNILVEGVEFVCTGSGVVASGSFENVTLQNNIFKVGNSGIDISGASSSWLIKDNVIEAIHPAIVITGAKKIVISNNLIIGDTGVTLQGCSQNEALKNFIRASSQGVILAQEAWQNLVQGNTIQGVSRSGIVLESGVINNQILANTVTCAPGASCLIVDVAPEVAKMNTIDPTSK